MKTLKNTFVFILFFSCVCSLTAQVMETVSYTPSKSGRYGTVTTRSLATFSGDVSAGSVTGLGEKLIIDAKQGYSRGGTAASLGAGRDIFTSVTATPTAAYVGGVLNTTQNSTITQLNAQNTIIYGGDTAFANSSVLVNKNGVLEIDRVKMKNPNCDIKWIKLPAYKVSSDYGTVTTPTSQNYWFAYCDFDNTTPGNGAWNATTSTVNLLGTCTAGWNGSIKDKGATEDFCTYGYQNLNSFFTCSAYTIKQCTGPVQETQVYNKYTKSCMDSTRSHIKTLSGYKRDTSDIKKCVGINRPKAVAVYNVTAPDTEYSIVPILDQPHYDCSMPNANTQSYGAMMYINEISERIRYHCGFSGSTLNAVGNNIKSAKNLSCQGNTVNYQYCSDLYGGDFTGVTNEQICETIKSNNPAGITNLNNFTCIKEGLPRNGYKASRAKRCNEGANKQLTYDQCKQRFCDGTRCPRDHNGVHYNFNVGYTEMWSNAWHSVRSALMDSNISISCNHAYTIPAPNYTPSTFAGTHTIYYEQSSQATLLHCQWED